MSLRLLASSCVLLCGVTAGAEPSPVVRDFAPVPGQPERLLVLEGPSSPPARDTPIEVLFQPDGRQCCQPAPSLEAVRLPAVRTARTFTLLSGTGTCVATSTQPRLVRRGRGTWVSSWDVDASSCPRPHGSYEVVLEGAHPEARLVQPRIVRADVAARLLPIELRGARVIVRHAASLPWLFVDAGAAQGDRALILRDGRVVDERSDQYLGPLLLVGDRLLVRYQPSSASAAQDLTVVLQR